MSGTLRSALILLFALPLGACVAVWGGPSHLTRRDPRSVTIQYDPTFTTFAKIRAEAEDSCRRYGRTARLVRRHRSVWRIVTARFTCVPVPGRIATRH